MFIVCLLFLEEQRDRREIKYFFLWMKEEKIKTQENNILTSKSSSPRNHVK